MMQKRKIKSCQKTEQKRAVSNAKLFNNKKVISSIKWSFTLQNMCPIL